LIERRGEINMAIEDIYQSIINLDKTSVAGLVQKELDQGTDALAILKDGLIAALDEVGDRFSRSDMFLPEMLAGAQVMKIGLDVIRPLVTATDIYSSGTVVIGTVKGDLHDIGKNLVAMMLEGAGFKVIDLGVDVPIDTFVREVEDNQPDIVGLSALLSTTLPAMRKTLFSLKERDVAAKFIVGGAPVTKAFAKEIGADGYSDDAGGAVPLVRGLITD
jgi:5-methyltetrahydrofolate--homocysteine methyltransferase